MVAPMPRELLARPCARRLGVEPLRPQLGFALGEVVGQLVVHVARHVGAPESAVRDVPRIARHDRLPLRAWSTRETAPEKRSHSVDSAFRRRRPSAVSS